MAARPQWQQQQQPPPWQRPQDRHHEEGPTDLDRIHADQFLQHAEQQHDTETTNEPIEIYISACENRESGHHTPGAYACVVDGARVHNVGVAVPEPEFQGRTWPGMIYHRATYLAANRAIEIANRIDPSISRPLWIISDNGATIKSMAVWIEDWSTDNAWLKANGYPVKNVDLIRRIYDGARLLDSITWMNVDELYPRGSNEVARAQIFFGITAQIARDALRTRINRDEDVAQ